MYEVKGAISLYKPYFSSLLQLRVVLAALLPVAAYQSTLPTDCSDVYSAGSGQDGVYAIYPAGGTSRVQVYCDMSKDGTDCSGEKWTVRMEDSQHRKTLAFIQSSVLVSTNS